MSVAYTDKKREVYDMNSLELTGMVTILANSIACKLTVDKMALVAGIFVQLADTLATIAAAENLCGKAPCPCGKDETDICKE